MIRQPVPAQFVHDHLEVLGFGSPRAALVQTVKELFENALDAVGDHGMIRLQLRRDGDYLQVVCTDNGTGMHANHITQLCGGVFATTKAVGQIGKFGLGLKAALLYSQEHVAASHGGLQVTTTLDSREIHSTKLYIDTTASDASAVIAETKQFAISEDHEAFSGTEVRLHLPLPDPASLVDALSVLSPYFSALRYSIASDLAVDFVVSSDLGQPMHVQHAPTLLDPIDRFLCDVGSAYDDIVHVEDNIGDVRVNVLAHVRPLPSVSSDDGIPLHVYRYGNHVPLLDDGDLAQCAISTALLRSSLWKPLGFKCTLSDRRFMLQRPGLDTDDDGAFALLLVLDVAADALKYCSLTKTSLDRTYEDGIHRVLAAGLEKLQALHPHRLTPLSLLRGHRAYTEYVPLIATAVTAMVQASRNHVHLDAAHFAPGGFLFEVASPADLEARLVFKMQQLLSPSSL
ncbi:hypothetical protein SPRG_04470 [Saprolegnia parasitica CBS 223.65]|uniref:Histidine kinase/HSP90-like ATPase domain-containing protein n=1 Tax=Saprolegnia parasitica (strain CBS 223.65) TaxID=695850 RepID=A0A067CIK9_SAPPC|nr:hypothetical protein SPRG_04470 [Saprolegnia parasitica CBS 223.65]KDO30569.1 hypothetical protein SPRG_04470 [Saprolegnia parasitica CBS 223.65]|eukprot:XP_012198784.1 hypothetical protein SPRG_04470 [Saprolegnia parasitica CBS 223.65]